MFSQKSYEWEEVKTWHFSFDGLGLKRLKKLDSIQQPTDNSSNFFKSPLPLQKRGRNPQGVQLHCTLLKT
jgi:hypothetical protein